MCVSGLNVVSADDGAAGVPDAVGGKVSAACGGGGGAGAGPWAGMLQ